MLFARVFILFFLFLPNLTLSQTARVGIHVDVNLSETEAIGLPVHFLIIDGILPSSELQLLRDVEKPLWFSSELQFIRQYDLAKYADSLSTAITDPIIFYRRAGFNIHTFILAYHPQVSETVRDFLNQKQGETLLPENSRAAIVTTSKASEKLHESSFYHIFAIDELSDFDGLPSGSTIYILPGTLDEAPARQLRHVLQLSIEQGHEIIIPYGYLRVLKNNDPRIYPLLAEFTTQENPIFALSDVDDSKAYISITIIALLICWMVFGMFFFGNGHYHRALSRYLFTHNFYVNDVMNRRLKTENDVLISLFVISLFSGLFVMTLAQVLDTHLILSSFKIHAPLLHSTALNEFVLFGVGFVFAIALIVTGTVWLLLAGGGRVSAGQILQLYLYPLHVVALAATLMAVLQLNQVHGSIHLIISGVTIVFLVISMIIAAGDIAPYLQQHKRRFTLAGPVLYAISISGIVAYLLIQTPFTDNMMLLVQLLD